MLHIFFMQLSHIGSQARARARAWKPCRYLHWVSGGLREICSKAGCKNWHRSKVSNPCRTKNCSWARASSCWRARIRAGDKRASYRDLPSNGACHRTSAIFASCEGSSIPEIVWLVRSFTDLSIGDSHRRSCYSWCKVQLIRFSHGRMHLCLRPVYCSSCHLLKQICHGSQFHLHHLGSIMSHRWWFPDHHLGPIEDLWCDSTDCASLPDYIAFTDDECFQAGKNDEENKQSRFDGFRILVDFRFY